MAVVEQHMGPPLIPLIKIKHDDKSDKDFVKLKLRRYPESDQSDLYELKISLFNNGDPEEFFLIVCNFNMTLDEKGTLETTVNVQYLLTLVHGEVLRQFDSLSADVEAANPLTVEDIFRIEFVTFPC